jgi:hypothetical protein
MSIRILNGFTCCARIPSRWKTGLICILIETNKGLALVDTGLGLQDYSDPTWFTQLFRIVAYMPFDPNGMVINQLPRFGYHSEDLKHIILTSCTLITLAGWRIDYPYNSLLKNSGSANAAR